MARPPKLPTTTLAAQKQPAPKEVSLVTARYLSLARWLTDAWGGSVAAAASHLGVHRSYLGTLLRGEKWNVGREAVRKAMERTGLPDAFFTAANFDVQHALGQIEGPGDAFDRFAFHVPPPGTTMVEVAPRQEKADLAHTMWLHAARRAKEISDLGFENATGLDFHLLARDVFRIYPVFLAETVLRSDAHENVQRAAGESLCEFLTSMHGDGPVLVSEAEFPMGKGTRHTVTESSPGRIVTKPRSQSES